MDYENMSTFQLSEILVEALYELGLNIATAESCTGGKIASSIVDISGCSGIFYEGIVSYSNNSKIDRLMVNVETLATYGAVSEETAIEMADGLLRKNVAIGVSTTGIAGPDGGSLEKPVGLVYIAVVSENRTDVFREIFSGGRNEIRDKATKFALIATIKHLEKNFM